MVHGGTLYAAPVLVTGEVRQRLESLTDLAPLHQPKSLAALDAVSAVLPDIPAVACFDTAFHATIPAAAATFALPAEWRARWTLRRYGFHGLSHAYVSRRAAELVAGDPRLARRHGLRVVTCHLGAGASLAAVHGGRSVDTTMGFTPLDGLVMATRSGSVDPGLVLWLEEHAHMPPRELAATLENRSGLTGLAGTGDMREVLVPRRGGRRAGRARPGRLPAPAPRRRSPRWPRPWTASTCSSSPAASARTRRRSAPAPPPASASSASPSTSHATPWASTTAATTGRSPRRARAVRTFVIAAREDKQIAAEVRSVLS